jgi:hypothetical protein
MLIGYAGGGTRNLIVNKPVQTIADMEQLPIRVMGAPIQTRIFEAIKAAPTVIAYDEVYNAIHQVQGEVGAKCPQSIEFRLRSIDPGIKRTARRVFASPVASFPMGDHLFWQTRPNSRYDHRNYSGPISWPSRIPPSGPD